MFFKGDRFKTLSQMTGQASTLGMHMVSGIVVGLAIGYYLDEYFETKPWLLMIFLLLGILSGFKMVYEDLHRMQRRQAEGQESSEKQNADERDESGG